jgi:prevent-host-death family protein
MKKFGIVEARNRLSELIKRVSRGKEFVITRRGKHVASLLPVRSPDAVSQVPSLATRIRRNRAKYPLVEDLSMRDLINDGRR